MTDSGTNTAFTTTNNNNNNINNHQQHQHQRKLSRQEFELSAHYLAHKSSTIEPTSLWSVREIMHRRRQSFDKEFILMMVSGDGDRNGNLQTKILKQFRLILAQFVTKRSPKTKKPDITTVAPLEFEDQTFHINIQIEPCRRQSYTNRDLAKPIQVINCGQRIRLKKKNWPIVAPDVVSFDDFPMSEDSPMMSNGHCPSMLTSNYFSLSTNG